MAMSAHILKKFMDFPVSHAEIASELLDVASMTIFIVRINPAMPATFVASPCAFSVLPIIRMEKIIIKTYTINFNLRLILRWRRFLNALGLTSHNNAKIAIITPAILDNMLGPVFYTIALPGLEYLILPAHS